jgi:hypothetical protein
MSLNPRNWISVATKFSSRFLFHYRVDEINQQPLSLNLKPSMISSFSLSFSGPGIDLCHWHSDCCHVTLKSPLTHSPFSYAVRTHIDMSDLHILSLSFFLLIIFSELFQITYFPLSYFWTAKTDIFMFFLSLLMTQIFLSSGKLSCVVLCFYFKICILFTELHLSESEHKHLKI